MKVTCSNPLCRNPHLIVSDPILYSMGLDYALCDCGTMTTRYNKVDIQSYALRRHIDLLIRLDILKQITKRKVY